MTERVIITLLSILILYFFAYVASGFVDFALQWFIDFRLRPYVSIPLYWTLGALGGFIIAIVNSIFSPNTRYIMGFFFLVSLIGASPHIIFRFIIMPMQIRYRFVVYIIYASISVSVLFIEVADRSIVDIIIYGFIQPLLSPHLGDGIVSISNSKYSIAFLAAIVLSQIAGYFIVRNVRYVEKVDFGDAIDAAENLMEVTTVLGRKMGYIKSSRSPEDMMHWAIQKGKQVSYPFFPGLSGGSSSGGDADTDLDVDL